MPTITKEIVVKVHDWLGEKGRDFFREVKEEHGTLNAVLHDGNIPHPVHFREGMQVRNFLRQTGLCDDWSDHDLDDNWCEVVEKAINGDSIPQDWLWRRFFRKS